VEVEYTLPEQPEHGATYTGQLKVVNSENENDYKWVTITFKTKDGESQNLAIKNILLSRLQSLFGIFQNMRIY
jgi:hypothetical protein